MSATQSIESIESIEQSIEHSVESNVSLSLDDDNDVNRIITIKLAKKENKEANEQEMKDDKDKFELPYQYALISNFMKTCLEDKDCNEIQIDVEIPKEIMESIIQYINITKGIAQEIIPAPLRSKVMKELQNELNVNENGKIIKIQSTVCADFIDTFYDTKGIQSLYQLIRAANYFDIKCLLHLGCAKVASLLKGKETKEITSILNGDKVNNELSTPSSTESLSSSSSSSNN